MWLRRGKIGRLSLPRGNETLRDTAPAPGRRLAWLHRAFVAGAAFVLLATALRTTPQPYGDAPEYLLMTESLARHGSPDLRDGDLETVKRRFLAHGIEFPPHGRLIGYYKAEDGRRYCYHFWAYSALCLPAKLGLRVLRGDELLALQLTNALLMIATLLCVLLISRLREPQRLLLNALLLFSPAVWFMLWPHPEVFSFAFAAMALVFMHRERWKTAIFFASLAALQNPQLVLLAAYLWVKGAVRLRARWRAGLALRLVVPWRKALMHALAGSIVLAYPLFYYAHFGTFSIVAQEATSLAKLSPARALGLLFDLNVGLLPYIPVALLAYLVLVPRSVLASRRLDRPAQLFLVFVAILLVNTLQWNYNHGTSGPSRYVIWMLPILFFTLASQARTRAWRVTVVAAIVVQAGIVWSRGGLIPRYDYLRHSPVASFVLEHAPRLYNPDYEVFIKRTLHVEGEPTRGPYAYVSDGQCRKVLAKRTHEEQVREICGQIPRPGLAFFRKPVTRKGERNAWTYINY